MKALVLAACFMGAAACSGDSGSPGPPGDTGVLPGDGDAAPDDSGGDVVPFPDAGADADTVWDTALDTAADTAADTETGTGTDGKDGGSDMDSWPDVEGDWAWDVANDIPPDIAPDVPPDLGPDTEPDVLWDVAMDIPPDIPPDIAPDIPLDIPMDIPPDIAPDIVPDAGPDDECDEVAKQVFVITEASFLLRFEPETLSLVAIGVVACPASPGATPFSMSVDRTAIAWVFYSDGSLWQVNTSDASCTATTFQPNQQGFELFGMGFSSDGPGTTDETLFIAGGDYFSFSFGTGSLGTIQMPLLMVTTVAPFGVGPGSPELTGTRHGELWGFFPLVSPPHVSRIDKANAGLLKTWPLAQATFGNVAAWAFAHWGGDFYLFFRSDTDIASRVWKLSGVTGDVTLAVPNTGHTITGAGVSTCAPTANPGP